MEAIARDYTPKGVQFYYVYKSLAHPGWNNYLSPFTLEERLLHVAEAHRTLGTSVPWLCDAMEDKFSKAMGSAPNSEFIIGPRGRIVARHGWSNPKRLRQKLQDLVGAVERPTDPNQLGLPQPRPASAATGVVARLQRDDDFLLVKAEPVPGDTNAPFYAKLRAEATPDLLFGGEGQLYLGFYLDPIFHVHWNNLVDPIQVELLGGDKIDVQPSTMVGPKVKVEADADPREFLVMVQNWDAEEPLTVTVRYFACNDDAGWCKPVEQSYQVHCEGAEESGMRILPEHVSRMHQSLDYRDGILPKPKIAASNEALQGLAGDWDMETNEEFRQKDWKLHLEYEDGQLTGWSTFDRAEPAIHLTWFDGRELRFLQRCGPAPEEVVLRWDGDKLSGTHRSVFGDWQVKGRRRLPKPPAGEAAGKERTPSK